VAEFGKNVYELDSINPRTMQDLIRKSILAHFDETLGVERDRLIRKGRKRIGGLFEEHDLDGLIEALEEGAENTEDDDEDEEDDA
jgi:hypothetical protein